LLTFVIDTDASDDVLAYQIPRMTLQPLVENAYIHGISDLEDGGSISIRLSATEKEIQLAIIDTGVGFNSDLLAKLNKLDDEPMDHQSRFHHGHTTGIGLNNLIQRLRYHTHVQHVIAITSRPGLTQVTLLLPRDTDEVENV